MSLLTHMTYLSSSYKLACYPSNAGLLLLWNIFLFSGVLLPEAGPSPQDLPEPWNFSRAALLP